VRAFAFCCISSIVCVLMSIYAFMDECMWSRVPSSLELIAPAVHAFSHFSLA